MLQIENKVQEIDGIRHDSIPIEVLNSTRPLLLRGLVRDWPVAQAARESAAAAARYLLDHYNNATIGLFFLAPEACGRIFYNEDLSGFNYEPVMSKLDEALDRILFHLNDGRAPAIYVGSTTVETCLPGFRKNNDIDLGDHEPLVSLWCGNRSRVAAHFDVPDNIACCAVGRRRFILFPPEELENLYVGPIDFTPAGQAISMVDFHAPDFERYPRFRKALSNAQVAEHDTGDALFLPSMWWHHVEALEGFNVLINYWWKRGPSYRDDPKNVLNHALLSLRELPGEQRKAWLNIFKHYVFEFDEESVSHIPQGRRGILSEIDENMARKIRADLLNRLNR